MHEFRATRLWSTHLFSATLVVAFGLAALSGCGTGEDASKAGEQPSIAALGRAAIERAGQVTLTGDLECKKPETATVRGTTPVNCTGITRDGKAVTLTGLATQASPTTMKAGKAQGRFAATVGGDQVLSTTCLGAC